MKDSTSLFGKNTSNVAAKKTELAVVLNLFGDGLRTQVVQLATDLTQGLRELLVAHFFDFVVLHRFLSGTGDAGRDL